MAVYTDFSDEEFDAFMKGYDLGGVLSLKGIAEGVENSNYLLVTEKGQFILTLYEKRVDAGRPAVLPRPDGASRRRAASPARCRSTIVPAARSAASPGGRRRSSRSSRRLGAPAARGALRRGRPGARPPAPCRRRLRAHAARTRFRSPAGGRSIEMCARPRRRGGAGARRRDRGASSTISSGAGRRGLPAGVIHADLFPDNVFFLDEPLSGLIDFYFACNDMLAYDVGGLHQRLVLRERRVAQHHQVAGAARRL